MTRIVYRDENQRGVVRRKPCHRSVCGNRIADRKRTDRARFCDMLDLPRATRYLDRYERGLFAFLERCGKPHRKAA